MPKYKLINKQKFKKLLADTTGCVIQHNGWPCGTCFYYVSPKLNNRDWQTVLYFRGDTKKEDLINLPKTDKAIEDRLIRIEKIFKQ